MDEKLCPSVLPEGAQENKEAVACSSLQGKSCSVLDDTLGFEQNPMTQCSVFTPTKITSVPQEPDHLFETISQAMLNAVDRDALSGMGVVVHIM